MTPQSTHLKSPFRAIAIAVAAALLALLGVTASNAAAEGTAVVQAGPPGCC
jgi:hypothetical protein